MIFLILLPLIFLILSDIRIDSRISLIVFIILVSLAYIFIDQSIAIDRQSYFDNYHYKYDKDFLTGGRDWGFVILTKGLSFLFDHQKIYSFFLMSIVAFFIGMIVQRISKDCNPNIFFLVMAALFSDRLFIDLLFNSTRAALSIAILIFGLVSYRHYKNIFSIISLSIHTIICLFHIAIIVASKQIEKFLTFIKFIFLLSLVYLTFRTLVDYDLTTNFLNSLVFYLGITNSGWLEAINRNYDRSSVLSISYLAQVWILILPILIYIFYPNCFIHSLREGFRENKFHSIFFISIFLAAISNIVYPDIQVFNRFLLLVSVPFLIFLKREILYLVIVLKILAILFSNFIF